MEVRPDDPRGPEIAALLREERAYRRLSLETGSMAAFTPAHRLYARFGFRRCGPFGDCVEDPNSIFMTREL